MIKSELWTLNNNNNNKNLANDTQLKIDLNYSYPLKINI